MRTNSRMTRCAAIGVSLALFLAACGSDDDAGDDTNGTEQTTTTAADGTDTTDGTDDEEAQAVAPEDNEGRTEGDGELVIGVVLPQSGNLAQLGPPMIAGAEMAARDINEAGGVLGQDVRLIIKDDGGAGDDDLAITSVDELINNDNVDAIVGAAASGTTKAIIDRVTSSGTVQCSPSNTGSDLTTWDDKGLYFRTPPADNLQAQALGKAITDDGHTDVAIISQNTDYGTGFVRFLEPMLSDSGATIVENVTYDETGTGIDSEVERIVGSNPDAIALIGYPEDGGRVVAELRRQGVDLTETRVYVTDGMQSNELYQAVDESDPASTVGIRGTAPSAAPESGASFFPDAFAEFRPEVASPIYSAQAYDCVMLIALAAAKAQSDAPYDIALEITNVSGGESDDSEKCETFSDCLAIIGEEGGGDLDYDGASGVGDFSPFGEPSAGEYEVYEFADDGSYSEIDRVVVGE